jgi:hypothetical protein
MLRSMKKDDRELYKWTTEPPRLTAQLEFTLAELRVNSPQYVRWWRSSQAGPPRLSGAGSNRGGDIRSLIASDPRIAKLDHEIKMCQTNVRSLRLDSRDYLAKHTVELAKQVAQAKMEVGEAQKKNYARFGPEYNWLRSMYWQADRRFYNKPYLAYHQELARKAVGRDDQECHENFGSLESIYHLQTEAQWHTRCDWEWRLRQEVDGSIKELPLLREWLEKVRGDVRQ